MMMKRLSLAALGLFLVVGLIGCDEESLGVAAANPALETVAARLLGNGDVLGDQLWQRDRLRDGTGENCPDPDDPGSCDGSGPHGTGAHDGDGGGYGGSGNGDQQRLRDGSCL